MIKNQLRPAQSLLLLIAGPRANYLTSHTSGRDAVWLWEIYGRGRKKLVRIFFSEIRQNENILAFRNMC